MTKVGVRSYAPEAAEASQTPSTRSLLRLSRFAVHRGRLVLLGFVLTLLTTAVGLIPPYLTHAFDGSRF